MGEYVDLAGMAQMHAQQQLDQQLYNFAKTIEDNLDDQMHKMENLDEDDLEGIRRKRMNAMKKNASKRQKWIQNGHGEYREIQGEKVRAQAGDTQRADKTAVTILA